LIPIDKLATIVQARMSSSRLPSKVMLPLVGKPLLQRMIERVNGSILNGSVIVATSEHPSDNPIEQFCKSENINCFRGSMNDLLVRHLKAAEEVGAEFVIKIPSDVPLIDPEVINRVIYFFFDNLGKFDFLSNLHPATYPDGNDVEIMTIESLRIAHKDANRTLEREHTTPYLWENPQLFSIANIAWETGLDFSMTHRWTIDYEEDYLFIKKIYDELYSTERIFSLSDILKLLESKPEISEINKKYAGVNWYRNHIGDLKTINENQTKQL
jgi:spore coat polysaccharide biosynthesis protein SpsF